MDMDRYRNGDWDGDGEIIEVILLVASCRHHLVKCGAYYQLQECQP